ncbi:MAG TPA: hypothetical protein VFE18_19055 [Phenylobacterium sp.]|jgi:hypothetical protein|uniref:hypothetical protein n=1 Tax=Phenylobacterium sp. TaxID=1871053 RepID=UPI002D3A41E3|nr:hypothetical protein [Phenylobacterium sp.]HZZ70273.1 hypothetical protein [Phenylobacterium sp.]
MGRIVAAILAFVLGANGAVMLFAGLWWYGAVPGVIATGPYNPHFVRDIGAAYLVAGASLAAFAVRPRQAWPALVAAAAFLTLHAAVHVFDAACGSRPLADVTRDFAGVYLPALIALALALRKPAV